MEALVKSVGIVVVFVGIVCGYSILFAYPTMWVVNYLFTPNTIISLFGIAQLTLWKALWLNFICGVLFKGSNSSSSKD